VNRFRSRATLTKDLDVLDARGSVTNSDPD